MFMVQFRLLNKFINFIVLMVGLSFYTVAKLFLFISFLFYKWQQSPHRYLSRNMCSIKDLNIVAFLKKCKVGRFNILILTDFAPLGY